MARVPTPAADGRAKAGLLAAFLVLLAGAELVSGDSASLVDALPAPRYEAAAVWDPGVGLNCTGGCGYVFGGRNGVGANYGDIIQYTPANPPYQILVSPAPLPAGTRLPSAVWAGSVAYVFGGLAGAASDDILVFDPVAQTLTDTGISLPMALFASTAVWDPAVTPACPAGCAYLFGGATHVANVPTELDTIIQVSPGLGTSGVVPTTLPTIRSSASSAWVPGLGASGAAVVMGGRYLASWQTEFLDDILVFFPPAGPVVPVATMPDRLAYASATYDGHCVYHFGGFPRLSGGPSISDTVIGFDPETFAVQTMAAALPSTTASQSSAWSGSMSYLFGGTNGFPGLDDIVAYDGRQPATVQAPGNVLALPGPGPGQVTVTWMPPSPDPSYCGHMDSYTIHRNAVSHTSVLHSGPGSPPQAFMDAAPSGTTQCYAVQAHVGASVGALSAAACAIVP